MLMLSGPRELFVLLFLMAVIVCVGVIVMLSVMYVRMIFSRVFAMGESKEIGL